MKFQTILDTINEKVAEWYPTDDQIDAYAEKNNLSWGAAAKELVKQHKKTGKADAAPTKSCWGCGKDWAGTRDGKLEGNAYLSKYKGKIMCPPCIEEYEQTHGKGK